MMLTLRGSAHIRTSRNTKGLHACPSSTGPRMFHVDGTRIAREDVALATRELRREWLAHLWAENRKYCRQKESI